MAEELNTALRQLDKGAEVRVVIVQERAKPFRRDLPIKFILCLRMRKNNIKSVTIGGKDIKFETLEDNCSNFVYIPMAIGKGGVDEFAGFGLVKRDGFYRTPGPGLEDYCHKNITR